MHQPDTLPLRRALEMACHGLVARRLEGPLASGNASLLDRERQVLAVSAKGVSFSKTTYGTCVSVRLDEGLRAQSEEATLQTASTELPLHLAAYRARPEAAVVLHTHSPSVVAAACLDLDELPFIHYHQALLGGSTAVLPYATPGSPRLAELVAVGLRESPVGLLANHGAVVSGSSVQEALDRAEILEDVCRLVVLTQGRERLLDPAELPALDELFQQYRA